MISGRQVLNDEDNAILNDLKQKLEMGIKLLQQNGVRHANIQIELEWHIRNLLKGD